MQKINLYRYETNGMVTVTPNAQNTDDEPSRIRLVADEGCALMNGEVKTPAVDMMLEDINLWDEVVDVDESDNLKAQAYDILMGVIE